MKNNLIFILAISLCISISDARQPNPFLEGGKPVLTEEQMKREEILNSDAYKKFDQFFDIPIHISIDEQKEILKNSHLKKLENLDDLELFLRLPVKEQKVLVNHYLMPNYTIPRSYFETIHEEKVYREKEKKIWEKFQELSFPDEETSCYRSFLAPSKLDGELVLLRQKVKYQTYLFTLVSILYVARDNTYHLPESVEMSNPFNYYKQNEIKFGHYPILTCTHDVTINIHYGNFLNTYIHENIELEKKYREIFLLLMKEEMLKDSKYIFVPLSIVREHAEQSGLSNYILKENSNKLMHQDLAVQYYGSYDRWMSEIFNFIDSKYIDVD